MASETEKREFTRVPISFKLRWAPKGEPLKEGVIKDLSMKGMLVVTEERPAVGTPCEAVITLVEGEAEIRVSGIVAALHPMGIGMEFSTIDGLESYMHLRNLVLFNTGDVERAEAEMRSHQGIRRKPTGSA